MWLLGGIKCYTIVSKWERVGIINFLNNPAMNHKKNIFVVKSGSKSYTFAVQTLTIVPREKVLVRAHKKRTDNNKHTQE